MFYIKIHLIDFCPPGWYATRSTCMMIVESDTSLSYEDAKTKCTDLDPIAYPVEPYNEYLQNELKTMIDNSSLTETDFWIGNSLLH